MGRKPALGNRMRLSTRFALMVGAIVCAFCAGSAVLLYAYLSDKVIQDTYKRGQIVFALMDGVGAYVGNTLRPKMFTLLSHVSEEDGFVAEAMSTTRIRHGVMGHVETQKPEFVYRRVSQSPRNPINLSDAFHNRMIEHFKESPGPREWHGIPSGDNSKTLFIVVPVYVKAECLKCHGAPHDAPPGMLKIYGSERGFGYREGDLMGVESISISLAAALKETHDMAIQVSTIGFCAMLFLFVAIEGTFLRLVGQPLQRLTARFDDITGGSHLLRQEVPIRSMDEIGELTRSFNTMAHHLAEAQETLQSNAEILQSIIDGISDPLALVNADGSLSVLNRAYQSWIADSRPAVLGTPGSGEKGASDPTSPRAMLGQALTSGRSVNGEWTGPDERCYFIHLYPILDESGQVSQVVHYTRDITLHKQAENQMMQMEKMAAIGHLSAGVAHEINNPLGVILCYAKLLRRDLSTGHPALEDVEVVERNAQACRKIVDNLLSFSRHGTTRKLKGQLNDGLSSVVSMLEKQFQQKGIELQLALDPHLPEFCFDSERLKQVYMNVLMNARQAMPQGGVIRIGTSFVPEDGLAQVRIQDGGTGIHPDNLERIFDPFFTTKQTGEGTGLGLSVSYGIVREHGGQIDVESTSGKGSTFVITLPAKDSHESIR